MTYSFSFPAGNTRFLPNYFCKVLVYLNKPMYLYYTKYIWSRQVHNVRKIVYFQIQPWNFN